MKKAGRVVRGLQLAAAGVLAVAVGGLIATSGASAQERDSGSSTTTSPAAAGSTTANTNTYTVSAQANALDVLITDPSLPLSGDLDYELGPWGASASLDSLGESLSDAGAPYAPSIYSLPGTINGIGSGDVPALPALPGYVSANFPNRQTDDQTQAGYQLTSSAQSSTSQGDVNIGVQPAGSSHPTVFASAQATANGDGSVTVSAAAGCDVLSFGQLLDLGNVSSSISMTQQAGQQPAVTSQTDLGTITLLELPTGLSPSGFNVLGLGVPIDIDREVLGSLNTILSKVGIKLTYLPETFTYSDGTSSTGTSPDPSKTLQSVDSGALEVSETQDLPSQGLTSVSVTLGRVYVSTSDSPGLGPPTGGGGSLLGPTALTTAPSQATPPLSTTGGLSPQTSGSTTAPSGGGTGGTPTSHPTPSGTGALEPVYAVERGPATNSAYLVLVLAALAMLLGTQAIRYLAVRLAMSQRAP
ncbi:MAG TPA: hypothetical protein VL961_03480 [Acidimicrobiales bacterium]|nr:hypothetical protein [Acidimicrobiales bacterium]